MLVKVLGWSLFLLVTLAVVSSYLLSRPLYSEALEQQAFDQLRVAPPDQAITLARTQTGKILLVSAADTDGISAIHITAEAGQPFTDTLDAYQHLGAAGVQDLYGLPTTRVAWGDLGAPLKTHYPHIAVGTNYRAHADEVGLDGEPFLFPKLSRATAWNQNVEPGYRLDHEVELCAVPLSNHTEDSPTRLGYLLCGDYTDRWVLIRDIELGGEMGRTGFPAGKGGETRLPIGPFLVIPVVDDFYQRIELSLYVNSSLRQWARAGQMVWTPKNILARVLADCRSPYSLGKETIYLVDCDGIVAGTLILTGTPEGVMFHIATLWNPWAYLREGDVVTSFGTYLGFTRNVIDRARTQ